MKIWARLILLQQRMMKQKENARAQKEAHQERKMNKMVMSATEQIQQQGDKSLEPKLEVVLAKRLKHMLLKPNQTKKISTIKSKYCIQHQRAICKKGAYLKRLLRGH